MIWNIITDSSCDLQTLSFKDENNELRYDSVPFVFNIGGEEFVDDDTIDIDRMLYAMEHSPDAGVSACPSPAAWLEKYEREGNVIAVTISKNLSGSYNSACAARDMAREEHPDKNIAVINSWSTGPALILILKVLCRCIKAGMSFDEVVQTAQHAAEKNETVFALSSFTNLVKNGRMSPVLGFVAQKLGFWGIGIKSPEGTIKIKGKHRGVHRAIHALVEDIRERGANAKEICICHCRAEEVAEKLCREIHKHWPEKSVEIYPTKGLCSFYAERNGIIVTYM